MADDKKLQVALYWGAACGGCDVAVLDTNEFVLEIAKAADIRLWPIAVDGKYKDVYNPETLQKVDRITREIIQTKGVVPYQVLSIASPKMISLPGLSGASHG